MPPLSFKKLVTCFTAVVIVLVCVDEAALWFLSALAPRQWVSALATAGVLFVATWRAGDLVPWMMKKAHNDDGLNQKLERAMELLTKEGRSAISKIVIYRSSASSAATINHGDHGCILITSVMVDKLSRCALAGVLSHEAAHVIKKHPKYQAYLFGAIALFKGSVGITPYLAVAILVSYLWMLRQWEHVADKTACAISSHDSIVAGLREYQSLSGERSDHTWWRTLLSAHPSIGERLTALEQLDTIPETASCEQPNSQAIYEDSSRS